MNPLKELAEHGQSYWLDNLTRSMIESGELERRVREEGLRGVTSNPAIFSSAIAGGEDYDERIRELVRNRRSVDEIYERLVVRDIRDACDVLRPVYDHSGGEDGFVSLEVSPYLARDPDGTVEEARRLAGAVDRPNVMIKIPGTREGLAAIERCLYEGINVNVTLLFSTQRYEAVADAWLSALERRLDEGKSVEDVASVASFFLSRIDVLVDRLLSHRLRPGASLEPGPEALQGRVAIANAKRAYSRFREILRSDRWSRLETAGARPQRLLWASTSTKDPLYSDVRYVEGLIGPDTVNTMPDRTIEAFADHGTVRRTVDADLAEARQVLDALAETGIDLDAVTGHLEDEGIRKFIDPYDRLMATLAERRREFLGDHAVRDRVAPGAVGQEAADTLDALDLRRFGRRLHREDPTLWSLEEETADAISERLGWLEAPGTFLERVDEVRGFARDVREAGTDEVLWLGMGGSSLAADVSRDVFGVADGFPRFTVLDDSDPDAVAAATERIDPERTLFVVASKSGTTTETISLFRHFWRLCRDGGVEEPGSRFAAITDPGTPLAEEADSRGFRSLFRNPPDVGGRYSALTYFGLVAAALQGVDVDDLLRCAEQMRCGTGPGVPAAASPGLRLGGLLGAAARAGRDKVTITGSPTLRPLARWLEQLLAESTGKDGTGLVPVRGEPLAAPDAYGDDRVFVHLTTATEPTEADPRLDELAESGHPVLRLEAACDIGLGAEFYRWEVATAAAGAVLGVNPFDQPNVEESKENTRNLLDAREETGRIPVLNELGRAGDVVAFGDANAAWFGRDRQGGLSPLLEGLLATVGGGDYLAVLPYFRHQPDRHELLRSMRLGLRDRTGAATTLNHGPRYLHSTGQLHKGGPDSGVFLLLTADPEREVPIPGRGYGFGTLQRAQAVGDLRSLTDRGRRALRLHLGSDVESGLRTLADALGMEFVARRGDGN